MRITEIVRHYVYIPYVEPVAPYWGWQAPSYGAHGVIVEMRTDEGPVGFGETAGRESIERHARCADAIVGRDPLEITRNAAYLRERGERPAAISGLEMAMWDLLGKTAGLPLHALLGGKCRPSVPLCGLMGVKPPEEAAETARLYAETWGFGTIKTKAGRDVEEDRRIAKALHESVGDRVRLRFDANENYSPEDVLALAGTYREISLEYFEQPIPHDRLGELSELRRAAAIPIALNESVTDAPSVLRIVHADAADVLIPDIPDAGGIAEVCKIAAVADAAGIPCAFHCWHDLGIKTAAMTHLVSALPAFRLASDTTYHGLVEDIIDEAFEIRNGSIAAPSGPGLGVYPEWEAIERYRKQPSEID